MIHHIIPGIFRSISAYARLFRLDAAMIALFSYLAGAGLAGMVGRRDVIIAGAVTLISTNFIYSLNSWADREIDKIDKPGRPIPSGRIEPKHALIYAGAQKNMGPSGLTVVVVRRDLLGKAPAGTPSMLDYAVHAEAGSMSNTPPTYAWYLAGLVYKWLKEQGGLAAVEAANRRKAGKLYAAIDASNVFASPVATADRSLMNVTFTLPTPELDAEFLAGAKAAGLLNLKGHRSVGGMRASIYNAVPEAAVDALVGYMQEFEQRTGLMA